MNHSTDTQTPLDAIEELAPLLDQEHQELLRKAVEAMRAKEQTLMSEMEVAKERASNLYMVCRFDQYMLLQLASYVDAFLKEPLISNPMVRRQFEMLVECQMDFHVKHGR